MTDKLRCRDGSCNTASHAETQNKSQPETGPAVLLVEAAAYLRENVVGVGTDQPDRAHDEHKDDSQHDSIFCDVLAFFFIP